MRERWEVFKASLRDMFPSPRWTHDDETDVDNATAARTDWVRRHRDTRRGFNDDGDWR